jgi:hypothetical protein
MSAFQAYYDWLHSAPALPPPPLPHARARPTLPPAFADDAWFRFYPEVAPRAEEVPEPGPAPVPPARPKPARAPGLRSLKQDVLEQLGEYQVYAARLKRWDPESYKMFRRIGMYIPPPDMMADRAELEPAVLRNLPGFGAVAIGLAMEPDLASDRMPTRFAYFRKLDRPGHDIERRGGGVIYRCHVYFDDAKDQRLNRLRGYGVGLDYAVEVTPDGRINALRMLQSKKQTIHHKRGRWRGQHSQVTHQTWTLPDFDRPRETMADWIALSFCLTMNFWAQSAQQSIIRVTATKGAVVMPFVVDVLQTPGFFADREPVTIDGKKRRIFHIVRAHVRHTKHGDLPIKTHFAGLRQFKWNGYDIAITVPGRDHRDIAEMTIGALEDPTGEEDASGGFMEQTEFTEIVADAIGAPQVAA